MKDLKKVYMIVWESGSYDSHQESTLGGFLDKSLCQVFLKELAKDISDFVASNKSRYPKATLRCEVQVDPETDIPWIRATERVNFNTKMMYPGMAALLMFLADKHPKLGISKEMASLGCACDGDLSIGMQEVALWLDV